MIATLVPDFLMIPLHYFLICIFIFEFHFYWMQEPNKKTGYYYAIYLDETKLTTPDQTDEFIELLVIVVLIEFITFHLLHNYHAGTVCSSF